MKTAKVYFLISEHGIFAYREVIETKNFYLVPVNNSDELTIYNKKLYRLEVEEIKETK